ncbi:oligosaccharide flippase family protein [Pseudoalteromonas sp. A757]|uniref:oligosaccharide flippase family protein n=1 Tax=Pseudoalteromonas sp. A757 TaxID=2250709 RepID=UPI000FFE93E2|nr:oligosaccharide flippase family protein [Pseudoalteromonas sp. A757]RXE84504.1 hypothetical protein DRB05_21540 [Pseudoalteromonas sp. A757]
MNFISILGKTSLVSILASCITYLSHFYLAANAHNTDFGSFTYYQSLMLLFVNIMPFGSTMAVVIFRFSLSENEYFKLVNEKIFILMPVVLLVTASFSTFLSFIHVINVDYDILFSVLTISFFNSVSLIIMGYYRVTQLFLKYGTLFLIYTSINSLVLVLSYFHFGDLKSAFYIISLSSMLFSSICYYSFVKDVGLPRFFNDFKKKLILSLSYGAPIVLSSLTMSFLVVGDKLILGNTTPELLTSYGVAALISSTTLFIVNNFASSWGAFLVRKCSGNDEQLLKYYRKNLPKLILVIPIGLTMLFAQYILYFIFYLEKNPNLFSTVAILTSAYLIFGMSKFFMGYMNYLKKNMAVFFSSLVGVAGVFSTFLLTEGVVGMALSILTGMVIQLFFCITYTNQLLKGL